MISNTLRIIIADDDRDDQDLLTDALVANGISRDKIILVSDGDELMSILPDFSKIPCLVFLDLNMPKKDGRKVLVEVRSNPELNHIPILIFTTSGTAAEVAMGYRLGGNTYFTKPFSYIELINLIAVIKSYWLEKAKLIDDH